MQTIGAMLEEWHSAADGPVRPQSETIYDADLAELRKSLKDEENDEVSAEFEPLIHCESSIDLPRLAKELADEVYVAFGTARQYGIPLEAVVAEVHRSNMTKMIDGKKTDDNGKVLKGLQYEEVDLEPILSLHCKLQRVAELTGGPNVG